jgi:hypothetical protein
VNVTDPDADTMTVNFYWSNDTLITSETGIVNDSRASIYLPDYIEPDWLDHYNKDGVPGTTYEWYVTISDEFDTTTGPQYYTFRCYWRADLNEDRNHQGADLSILVNNYFDTCANGEEPSDITEDGNVNGADLSVLVNYYFQSY